MKDKQKNTQHNKSFENRIDEIKTEIEKIWVYPYSLMGNNEKDTFKHYCKRWDNGPRVGRLFRDSNLVFFPLLYSKHAYEKLDELWDIDKIEFVNLLSECKYPYLLHDYLVMRTRRNGRWDVFFEILRQAPVCSESHNGDTSDVMSEELCNVLAPTIINIIGWYLLDLDKNGDLAQNQDYIDKFVIILSQRDDGFFLAYHYVRYLLWKSNLANKEQIQRYSDFFSVFTEPFFYMAEKQFYKDESIRFIPDRSIIDSSIVDSEKATKTYVATGKISEVSEKGSDSIDVDILLNFRTVRWFLRAEKYAKPIFVALNQMFAYDSLSFVTSDFKVRLEYYEIAELLMAQADPLGAWSHIQNNMLAMKQRLISRYHGDKSNELNYRIRFMWNVNFVMLSYLYEAEIDGKIQNGTAKTFWGMIWKDGIDYIRRYSRFCGIEAEEYLCRLICYHLVCFIRNGENSPIEEEKSISVFGSMHVRPYHTGRDDEIEKDEQVDHWIAELMYVFEQIEEMPIVVLRAIVQLLANGLRWEVVIGGSHGEFFCKEFIRAVEVAEGQSTYDWVGSFLKQRGFIYKKEV